MIQPNINFAATFNTCFLPLINHIYGTEKYFAHLHMVIFLLKTHTIFGFSKENVLIKSIFYFDVIQNKIFQDDDEMFIEIKFFG